MLFCEDEGVNMDNKNSISKIKEAIERSNEVLDALADLYKVFADATRVKILVALTQSEMCVGDISEFLDITQSAVSHQLRVLKTGGLVKSRRDGKTIVYSLADAHVRTMIDCGMQHITE
ncbi:MAG: winged helix-turn-helix transcriptional regulator [Clostridia bacterium]|nr:winged helix-turn-helix transcriptional regulator [Clostridia bacterium]